MLTAIRKHTKSFVVKILAGVLVASFALWGVSDMVRAVYTSESVFEIGDVEVGPQELESEVRREVNRLRNVLGERFGIDEARSLGMVESVLQRRINNTALGMAAGELGVGIGDDLVRDDIRNNPAFQGLGGFDQFRFHGLLERYLLTEDGYVARVRQELTREQLLESLRAEKPPRTLVDAIYRHRQEKRIARTIVIADAAQRGFPEPDAAAIEQFYRKNAQRFTAPEYRALTVVRLEAADLAAEIAVPNAEIEQAYEARADEYTARASRVVEQMIVPTAEEAERARNMIAEGRTFAAVAADVAGMDAAGVALGRLTRADLPFPELAEPVFALKDGETSAPVQSPLGWHLFRVTGIEPGKSRTLDEVRGELKAALAREKAIDSLFELANKLEDSFGGGATLEEAARQLNLKLVKIPAIDADGLGPDGKPVEGIPGGEFLGVAFATDEGADSLLTETGTDGYFVLRVDGVTPPALKPLDTVTAEAVEAWKAERRAETARKVAETVVARINVGTDFDFIASELALTPTTSPPVTRRPSSDDSGLPQPMIDRLFAIKKGEAAMTRSGQGYVVARLEKIIPADPSADRDARLALAGEIGDAVETDILVQLAVALRDRYGVTIHRRAVNELFTGAAAGGGSRRGR
ncbi:MAG: peptidyl-prolyl cis-trans isomerase [Rhodospirillales bacterium]